MPASTDSIGALFVANDRSGLAAAWQPRIDYLEYAPRLKEHFAA